MSEIIYRTFDLDGTILLDGKIPSFTSEAFQIAEQAVPSTIITGKSIGTTFNALGPLMEIILPSDRPFGVEGGGRIVSRESIQRGKNLLYHPLSSEEITQTINTLTSREDVTFFAYCPEDPRQRMVLWTANNDKAHAQSLMEKFGTFADVFTSTTLSVTDLHSKALVDKPCKITIKSSDATSLLMQLKGLNYVPNEGFIDITSHNVTKASALVEIAQLLNIPIGNVGFGGNDFNDEPAFTVPGIGEVIAVGAYGDGLERRVSAGDFIQVNTPQGLAEYIRTHPRGRRVSK